MADAPADDEPITAEDCGRFREGCSAGQDASADPDEQCGSEQSLVPGGVGRGAPRGSLLSEATPVFGISRLSYERLS
jgi:hypothetical protein